MKKHIITITGYPGSGKSSTAKGVAAKLGYEYFSAGDFFRKMAAARGLSVKEINIAAEKEREIDFEIDELLKKIGKEKDNMVIDSRLAFHWIPDSFKVFLDVAPEIAFERVFQNIQSEGRISQTARSVEEVREDTLQRLESEHKRYLDLYHVDIADKKQFDLVVDTGANNLEAVIKIIVDAYRRWLLTNEK